jgi:cytoskeletal protein RodZ
VDLGGNLDLVERLGRLREQGALTDEEFASAKANVLGHGVPVQSATAEEFNVPDEEGRFRSVASKWIGGIGALVLVAGFGGYAVLRASSSQPLATRAETPTAQGPSSQETDSTTAQADAALNSAADAVQAAADNLASASGDETVARGQTAEQHVSDATPIEAANPASPDQLGKQGRCRLNVGGRIYADGQCWVRLDSDGSFQVMSVDQKYFAQLIRRDGEAKAVWNASPGSTHADSVIGYMTRHGACWSNAYGEICAWAQ